MTKELTFQNVFTRQTQLILQATGRNSQESDCSWNFSIKWPWSWLSRMFLHDRRNSSSRRLVKILKCQLASKISISNDYESDFPECFHTTGTTHPPDCWWKKCSKVSLRLEFSYEMTMKLKFQNVFTRHTQLILQTSGKNSQNSAL